VNPASACHHSVVKNNDKPLCCAFAAEAGTKYPFYGSCRTEAYLGALIKENLGKSSRYVRDNTDQRPGLHTGVQKAREDNQEARGHLLLRPSRLKWMTGGGTLNGIP
jgi:hypothetical protein